MKMPIEAKPALWGAAAGAVALAVVGFSWGGWTTGGNAEKMARSQSDDAVVAALAPVCVDRFESAPEATANRAALKAADTWSRGDYVEKGGWATVAADAPAGRAAAVARACALLLAPG